MKKTANSKKGVFLTLDVAVAVLLLFTVVLLSFAYYWGPESPDFGSRLLRVYSQDAATVLSASGSLSAPLDSENNTDTSGIREILRATPESVCMQVAAYGIAVPEGLVGYWKMDDDSESYSAADSSPLGFDGSIDGNATFISGRSGKAAYFDGSSYILAGEIGTYAFQPTDSFSAAAWVYLPSLPGGAAAYPIIANTGQTTTLWGLWVNYGPPIGSNQWTFAGSSANIYGSTATTGWHHVVITQNASNASRHIYVDMDLNASGAAQTMETDSIFAIGSGGRLSPLPSPQHYFTGAVDEVRIYNRTLSAQDIEKLYSNPSNLLYVVDEPGCAFSGGETQTLVLPFAHNKNQLQNNYYRAVITSWHKGTRK